MGVKAEHIRFSYGAGDVLRDVSFSLGRGEVMAVLGPNGVGKSTLFQCLLGFLKPSEGIIRLDGREVSAMSQSELARTVAYIPQSGDSVFHYTVLDMVTMGMTGQLGLFQTPGPEHRERALATLRSLGIDHLADRSCNRISGGERQLMLVARALVQDAKILLMDEPTANLDYGNSYAVMRRVRALGEEGYAVIFSTHEPNQAFRYADRVLALKDGGVLAEGRPGEALTEDILSALYGVRVAVRPVTVDRAEYAVSIPCERGEAL